jgi:hypothetical protein
VDEVVINGVRPASCGSECRAAAYGYSVAAIGGSVSLEGFDVQGPSTCGACVDDYLVGEGTPSLDLARGVIAAHEIGACVQVEGYDLERLRREVEYLDNDTNLDITTLPVPDEVQAIEL